MADQDSLIDWSGPAVEYINKPLIPLPSFDHVIDVGENNPFDAVERQINENELLDIFNINLSFNENDDSKCNEDGTDDSSEKIITRCVEDSIGPENNFSLKEFSDDDLSLEKSEENGLQVDTSFIFSLSSLSDFKEMVQSRISSCMNKIRDSNLNADHCTVESEKSDCLSPRPEPMNDCFIARSDELKAIECEDLQSIKPNWDEYLISSSDEENEKPVSFTESKRINETKTTFSKPLIKSKNVRAPLISQDTNIRIRKTSVASKPRPLKAVLPIPNIKKLEDRKSSIALNISNMKTMTAPKSKIASMQNQARKLKKFNSPMATSTPQNSRISSLNLSRNSLNSNSLTQKHDISKSFSHPPSPDSTTDSRIFSRIARAASLTPKNKTRNISSNIVSSSTKDQCRTSFKLSKEIESKSNAKTVRNKENLKPFRYC